MSKPSLRDQILSGTAVGTFLDIPSAMSAEIVAGAGFDLVCIDAEHGGLSLETIDAMIRGAQAAGVPALVRVPELGPEIARVLDLGATGVLVPRVETAEQAAEAVSRSRFAPAGLRGAGPGRASGYGYGVSEYLATANDQVVVAIQIETLTGLANVAEIAAVPGVDVLFVGPLDLAVSLGTEIGSAEHTEAQEAIFTAAEQAGVARGAFCLAADAVKLASDQTRLGLVLVAGDFMFIGQAAAQNLKETRAVLGVHV